MAVITYFDTITHPDWILRTPRRNHAPLNKFTHPLNDLTHPRPRHSSDSNILFVGIFLSLRREIAMPRAGATKSVMVDTTMEGMDIYRKFAEKPQTSVLIAKDNLPIAFRE